MDIEILTGFNCTILVRISMICVINLQDVAI